MRRAVLCLCAAAALSGAAAAAGAIAVGEPADVGKDGLALGLSYQYPTPEAARAEALAKCRVYAGVGERIHRLCTIVKEFSGECAATAYDPAPGTPGWGYGVAFTADAARDAALGACRLSAGVDRARFCESKSVVCDQP